MGTVIGGVGGGGKEVGTAEGCLGEEEVGEATPGSGRAGARTVGNEAVGGGTREGGDNVGGGTGDAKGRGGITGCEGSCGKETIGGGGSGPGGLTMIGEAPCASPVGSTVINGEETEGEEWEGPMEPEERGREGVGSCVLEGGSSGVLEVPRALESSSVVAMGVGTTSKGSWQEAGGVQEVLGNTDGTCTTSGGEEEAVVVSRRRGGTVCEGRGS